MLLNGKSYANTCNLSQAPKTLLSPLKESRLGISDGPWTFALVIIKEMMPKDFDLNQLLLEAGITINMVPFINKHEDPCSYILIVAIPYLDLLSMKLHGSMLIIDFDLLEPSKEDERCHGIWKAKERARHYTLGIALHATRMRWNYGLVEFLRVFLRKAGLELEFERAILTWDIQVSCLYSFPPDCLLIIPSIPNMRPSSSSHEISCSFVWVVVTVTTAPLLLKSRGMMRKIGSNAI